MGQYHYTVNLDKREFINPHKLGDGLKLLEQCGWTPGGTNDALHLLLACSSGRGGGDFQTEGNEWVGRWAGDRIAVVGDYAEAADLAPEHHADQIYHLCRDAEGEGVPYTDITDSLIPIMEREYEILYLGDGRVELREVIDGFEMTHGIGDRTAVIAGRSFAMSSVREAVRRAWKSERDGKLTLAQLKAVGLTDLHA